MYRDKSYNLSTLIQIGNLCIGLIAWLLYYHLGPNKYVDIYTILLTSYISIQNILMLAYEKKNRDPYIVILILNTSLFYVTRVISFLYDPWSLVLLRYELSVNDLNYSFLFIAILNISIFLGLISTRSRITFRMIKGLSYKAGKSPVVLLILLISLVFSHLSRIPIGLLGQISGYIAGNLLNPSIVILFTIVYTLLYYKYLSSKYKVTLLSIVVVFFGHKSF
jgi:hypothetical protein